VKVAKRPMYCSREELTNTETKTKIQSLHSLKTARTKQDENQTVSNRFRN